MRDYGTVPWSKIKSIKRMMKSFNVSLGKMGNGNVPEGDLGNLVFYCVVYS